jgi:Ca-activated chloride channel family protein
MNDTLPFDWPEIRWPNLDLGQTDRLSLENLQSLHFAAPDLLWALAAVPVIALLYLLAQRRRGRYAVRFTNLDLLATLVERTPSWRRHLPPLLYLAALSLLLASLAQPRMIVQAAREEATVALVMDVSGSMEAQDVTPTRLDAAKAAANTFLDQLPEKFRVGLVSFNDTAQPILPPTSDQTVVRGAVAGLRAQGGTAMGDAIMRALESTGASPATTAAPSPLPSAVPIRAEDAGDKHASPVVIMLLSDGANTGGATEPDAAARAAAQVDVPIFTIALGTPDGTIRQGNQPRQVPPDLETLARIAEMTGGQSFSAPTEEELSAIYQTLGSQLGYVDEEREISAAFVGAALVVLLAGGMSALHWFNRFP